MITSPPAFAALDLGDFAPRKRLGGAAWAELERVLSREESPAPGPFRCVPWQVEILDALADPAVTWLVLLKAAQVGASELVRCAVGRWALLDPGDVLWVMTTQDAAEASMRKLQAMFRATPALRHLLSGKRGEARLLQMILTNGMKITIGWAGSPQSLASDPQRYVILDEVAKYATQGRGGEADAVSFSGERTKVYGRRGKRILLSSPKHDTDLIVTSHRATEDRREFAIPCLLCGLMQPLTWSAVRWAGGSPDTASTDADARLKAASVVERSQEAWVECSGCRGRIDTGKATRDARAGWAQEEGSTAGGGRRAYHVDELLHWETTLASLVAKFLRCTTPSQIQGFYNGSLGIPYEAATSSIPPTLFVNRATFPSRLVPSWATAIICTADTQLRGWWWMTRAWGPGWKSRLLTWGFAEEAQDLVDMTLGASFEIEGRADLRATACMLAIDTAGGLEKGADGSRTGDAYRLVLNTPGAYALKGDGNYPDRAPTRQGTFKLAHESFELEGPLYLVNKSHYADEVSRVIKATSPVLWEECKGAEDHRYAMQMSSEHKVMIETESGRSWRWKKRSGNRPNHMWDLARYQYWAAEFCQVSTRTEPTWKVPAPQEQDPGRRIRTVY